MRLVWLAWLAALAPAPAAGAQEVRSINPHGELPAGLDCTSCHTTDGWSRIRADMAFDHDARTRFGLTGKHRAAACAGCHLDLRFDEPRVGAQECAYCHVDVHRGRLSANCAECHDTESFAGRFGLEAHARTNFPLTGAHGQIACEGCHTDDRAGAFTSLDATCTACHGDAYQATAFPDHAALAYPTDCRACHGTLSWRGAQFDHAAAGGIELVGAHARLPCASCHLPPDHSVPQAPSGPEDCVSCHRADYDREHAGTGYPTTCTMCHGPDRWDATAIDHDAAFFPIFSGKHAGRWRSCQECHTDPQGFATFTCLTCHTQAKTDEHHKEEPGYAYESTRCLACHPRGDD